ncbi:hypothetical protein AMS68_003718 [Peltaster fructicola]|uniref:Uncharacterized protein n=1 Tax=Peltaster fructicola TaxID=286661 RepID=A0A6H0XU56_9PEZI|nr:hypothetical protein AMS68_003718 [Peltaster fructicola]
MRFLAILPIVLSAVALILTFLCVFAGNTTGFMEDYALITLNTSRFGENIVNLTSSSSSSDSSNVLQNIWNDITNTVSQDINDEINAVAKELGLRDFYSLHSLTYCEGYYEPGAIPNATLSRSQIWQNTTWCSARTALFTWDPRQEIQKQLNASGAGYIDITKLNWPTQLDDNIHDIQTTFKAAFVIYCIAIALFFIAFITAVLSIFFLGRIWTMVNIAVDTLSFIAVLIASALITAVMQQGAKNINGYGEEVGIEAYYSSKFLAITWVATGLAFVASCVWCVDCCIGRRDKRDRRSKRLNSYEDGHHLADTKAFS